MRCGAVRCGAVRCGAVRCGAVRCGAVRCGAVRCDVHNIPIFVSVRTWRGKGECHVDVFVLPILSFLARNYDFLITAEHTRSV